MAITAVVNLGRRNDIVSKLLPAAKRSRELLALQSSRPKNKITRNL
jgi:hypothetical protein